MIRRTTLWEDLGIGALAGATIVLASAIWVLLAADRNGLGQSGIYRARPAGTNLEAICPEMKSRLESRPETDHGTQNGS